MSGSAYIKLCEKYEIVSNIYKSLGILSWDNSVMMPEAGAEDRARQMATLGGLAHNIITAPEISDWLDGAEQNEIKNLDEWQQSNLRLMRKDWIHSNAIDEKLLKEFSIAGSKCESHWRTAKEANDFQTYAHFLKPVLELSREIAGKKAEALGLSKYDALMDQYDAGRKSADIDVIFEDLKSFLPDFIDNVRTKQGAGTQPIAPKGGYSIKKQKKLAEEIMAILGFEFDKGRLDISAHPFSTGTPFDTRITTRYSEDDFTQSLMGVFHETGHSLYTLGQPQQYIDQPVGDALGMSIHESQSLLVEMQVTRSREFVNFLAPYVQKYFGEDDFNTPENLYLHYNKVESSLIRIDADEVTYPIHIIIRYEIEKQLIEGTLEIDDMPELWNKMMKDMLDVTVPSDKEGCMQDIHWSDGSFGYFPTYTLGAMTAAQLFGAAKEKNPNLMSEIESGNFTGLLSWLRENIHSKASLHTAEELIEKATGQKLNAEVFKDYLKNKYLA